MSPALTTRFASSGDQEEHRWGSQDHGCRLPNREVTLCAVPRLRGRMLLRFRSGREPHILGCVACRSQGAFSRMLHVACCMLHVACCMLHVVPKGPFPAHAHVTAGCCGGTPDRPDICRYSRFVFHSFLPLPLLRGFVPREQIVRHC